MADRDEKLAEQVISLHAEGKGVREIARTLKKAPRTASRIISQISDRGVLETSNEQQTKNTETVESTKKQWKSNTTSVHGLKNMALFKPSDPASISRK